MSSSIPRCARHPDVTTRLTCSACETPICPDCAVEAAISYQCPDCAFEHGQHPGSGTTATRGPLWGFGSAGRGAASKRPSSPEPSASSEPPATDGPPASPGPQGTPEPQGTDGASLPTVVGVKATAAAVGAAMVGGLLLGPVLLGGTFFLLSAGVIGWGVARLVYLAAEGRDSPYLRALALTAAGFTVAVGLGVAGAGAAPTGLLLLAYPAAVYGGWIVVRGR